MVLHKLQPSVIFLAFSTVESERAVYFLWLQTAHGMQHYHTCKHTTYVIHHPPPPPPLFKLNNSCPPSCLLPSRMYLALILVVSYCRSVCLSRAHQVVGCSPTTLPTAATTSSHIDIRVKRRKRSNVAMTKTMTRGGRRRTRTRASVGRCRVWLPWDATNAPCSGDAR